MLTEADRQLLLTDPDEYVRAKLGVKILAVRAAGGSPEDEARMRREVCRFDPLLFSLVYFRTSLRAPETGNVITLSEFHLDIADAAVRWARQDIGPEEIREAWVAPRGSGKTTWMFLILPCWALAYGHRRYVMAFADNATMATNHLATFKRKVQTENPLLRKDFPDLCAPARRPGGFTDSDRQNLYLAKSGATFQASGIDSTTLGAKVGDVRPDLIIFDDIEPPAENYSAAAAEGRLSLIREAIFPMSLNAVVAFVGTTTMEGGLIDQMVGQATRAADAVPDWVRAENISTRYFPAIVTGDDGVERSLWPARWTTEYLQDMRVRSPRVFAMNFMNQPVPLSSDYWTSEMFTSGTVSGCTKHILVLDPAVTTKRGSDYTGIAVLSWSPSERKVWLRHAEQVKLPPNEVRLHVLDLLARFPEVHGVLVEINQGGDVWKESVLHSMPVPIDTTHETTKKELRWAEVLDLWSNGMVVHDAAGTVGPFERQAVAVPNSVNDDVVDAVVGGVRYIFKHWGSRPVKRKQDRVQSYVGR